MLLAHAALSNKKLPISKGHEKMSKADIGLVGLAVMGENLILNMESKGFTVACFNRTTSKVDDFLNARAKGKNIIGCKTVEELVASLKAPRRVMLMVKAAIGKMLVNTASLLLVAANGILEHLIYLNRVVVYG